MGLVVGMLIGLGVGGLWWAGQADAVPAPAAAYTAVTPCVVFDSRASQGATGAFVGPLNGGQAVIYKVAGTFGAAQGGGNTDCGVRSEQPRWRSTWWRSTPSTRATCG